jgi:hypothetical protein
VEEPDREIIVYISTREAEEQEDFCKEHLV